MATVSKSDLVKRLSEKTGTTQKVAETHLNALIDSVKEILSSGDELRLVGFGTFSVADVAERDGVNPRTREKIRIPASKRVKFAAGKDLSSAVGGTEEE